MFHVKFSVPTYITNDFGPLDKKGEVQISSDVDTLSDEYPRLKAQIDDLLKEVGAENRLVLDLEELERKCNQRKNTLYNLQEKIKVARQQLLRMEAFLKRLGIDPTSYTLIIDEKVALREAANDDSDEGVSVEVEVDPIPFDSGTNKLSHEF